MGAVKDYGCLSADRKKHYNLATAGTAAPAAKPPDRWQLNNHNLSNLTTRNYCAPAPSCRGQTSVWPSNAIAHNHPMPSRLNVIVADQTLQFLTKTSQFHWAVDRMFWMIPILIAGVVD